MGALMALGSDRSSEFDVVLLYHSVGSKVPWAVPIENFRRQLQLVKSRFRVVTLAEMQRLAPQSPSSKRERLLSITFDDGALDNYTHAFPALEDAGLKATFFVVSGCMGGTYKASYYETPTMGEGQVKELSDRGHEIGSHSVSHPHLTQLPRQEMMAELRGSKQQLEDLVAKPVTTFCYPFGDCNPEVRNCVQEAGFCCATGIDEGLCRVSRVNWLMVPRVDINSSVGMLQFKAKISSALERYEKLRGRRNPAGDPLLSEAIPSP
jgi:peptidoglycan/xylan/chitin deacetylase (PgdA/CDA1 family)